MFTSSKFYSVIVGTGLLSLSLVGSANGVEKVLPADAANPTIYSVELGGLRVGEKLVSRSNDGDVYEAIYTESILVTVTYDSADKSDAPRTGNGNDGQFLATDNTKPTVYVYLRISKEQYSDIKNHKYAAASLVAPLKMEGTRVIKRASRKSGCRYDHEYNQEIPGSCRITPLADMSVDAKVLTVSLKP